MQVREGRIHLNNPSFASVPNASEERIWRLSICFVVPTTHLMVAGYRAICDGSEMVKTRDVALLMGWQLAWCQRQVYANAYAAVYPKWGWCKLYTMNKWCHSCENLTNHKAFKNSRMKTFSLCVSLPPKHRVVR